MSKAIGVTPAADHAAATAQPRQGSVPALNQHFTGVPIFQKSDITLTAALDPMLTNDIYVGACLPANSELIDAYLVCGDIDTAAALTLTVARLYQDFTDIVASSDIITASTVGQAGGVARAAVGTGSIMAAPVAYDTWYGIKVANAPTGLNANVKMRLVLVYVPAESYTTGPFTANTTQQ
jgi:hypothetical protein